MCIRDSVIDALSYFHIVRFTANGQRELEKTHDVGDGNFTTNDLYGDAAAGLAVQEDGDILMVGRFNEPWRHGDASGFGTLRLNELLERDDSNGGATAEFNIDLSNTPGGQTSFVNSSLVLPDGKVLLVGTDNGDVLVTRHLASGRLDVSFGDGGKTAFAVHNAPTNNNQGYRATLGLDGKILITGYADNGGNIDVFVARMTASGLLDSSFGSNGVTHFNIGGGSTADDYGYAIVTIPDGEHKGKIVVAGRSGDNIALLRLMGDFDDREPPSNITLTELDVDENSDIGTLSLIHI